ncbi:MAG: hypothetical protein ACLTV1_09315 [Christensenellales bacterium]
MAIFKLQVPKSCCAEDLHGSSFWNKSKIQQYVPVSDNTPLRGALPEKKVTIYGKT